MRGALGRVLAVLVGACLVAGALVAPAARAATAPVGQGFVVTPSDLAFILKQIKIAEAHVRNTTSATGPCGALVGTGPDQIPSPLVSRGLRTVDGSCNNLQPGQETFGAADRRFPRLTTPVFKDADPVPAGFGPPGPTSYKQKTGNVFDAEPRVVSNLIVDQTSTNPAAVAAAGFPVRSQGNEGVVPCTTEPSDADPDGTPDGCVPAHQTLFIPNVTTDVGLSPPYNSLFTIFGQFFDHGVDQTVKGGGTVFVPLKDDDPLIAGPDHVRGNGDDLPPSQRFMVLTRAKNQPGPDGVLGTADDVQDAVNTDSPWVDQSQTYTSHPSHQVFLREYTNNGLGRPVATGKLLAGSPRTAATDGGMATWAAVKAQASSLLGLQLVDQDATDIPMLAADPYGNFIPGPQRGLPQYVTTTGLVEGDRAADGGKGVPVPANALHFDTPFLTDIAHNADPSPQDTDHNPATPPVAPTPDADNVASADFANQPAGTYDDEMLDAHFTAGDGRVNENIALTAVHQIFHSEHDRLVDYVKGVLTNDTSATGVAALHEWQLQGGADGWNGERLFQAARFVTEMEYQHLVFEEFARKVQPAINPFQPFAFTQTELNPAIKAEFAHAVYRFGHSMLTETISRTNDDGSANDIPLLDGFLNPPAYTQRTPGGASGALTSEEAAGSIIMGMSDQVGNELDEFVTETLRNNLLGLPLDLATINMTRAREAGVPPLNEVRRQIYAATNDSQLKPYANWIDWGQGLKHPESLVNFVAAYGTHPSISAAPNTLASRREAARVLVDPAPGDVAPEDAADFMGHTGTWADRETGLDNVDLWVGGLAERTNLFGGLLGSTFNYVFENQLTDLQNGDRLYYLARTPGMNLRTQLEGNSFAELVMRNTNAHTLKADAFATADCKFQLANLHFSGTTVADDPASECDESKLLIHMPDGTVRYRERNPVDPPGINGQSVYNGTSNADRIWGGVDNDTFLGNAGNDIIEGNDGADVALGGEGDDIITDSAGDDVPKGGPGNDAIEAGPGLDIVMGGEGKDFTNGGANINETFAGDGDDFVMAGQGEDAVFGDSGHDWEEGGDQPDLLQGDSGDLFFLDTNKAGSDILIGQGGDDDYDGEGGDDVFVAGPGIEKNAGAAGYDWSIGLNDPQAQDADLALPFAALDILTVGVRDKFNEVEALSGWDRNDTLRGDDVVPSAVGGGGFIGCDALDQAGLDRIAGLDALVPPLATDPAPIAAASAIGSCPLQGPVWGDGNIILGGAGSDLIEGRGADDIIDGDRYLNVRLSVRTDPANPATEIGTTDLMEHQYLRDANGQLVGPTLQQAVFAGTVNPGNIVAVREILSNPGANDVDTAQFSDVRANYDITTTGDTTTVVHLAGAGADGTDTLRNVEQLRFSDETIPTPAPVVLTAPGAPTNLLATPSNTSATLTWTTPVNDGGSAITSFQLDVRTGTTVVRTVTGITGTATSTVITGLTNGTAYNFVVRAVNAVGTSADSAASAPVTPATAPSAPTIGTAVGGNAQATVNWTAPASNGGSPVTEYQLDVRTGTTVVRTVTGIAGTATSTVVTGLTNGTTYNFRVRALNAVGSSVDSAASNAVTPATVPSAPTIGTAVAASNSVTVNWTAPNDGGSPITGYELDVRVGATLVRSEFGIPGSATSQVVGGLTNGTTYTFVVRAVNALGASANSAASNPVTPASAPSAPTIGTAVRGNASATVNWTAPASNGGSPITEYRVDVRTGTTLVRTVTGIPGTATSTVVSGLTNGTTYNFVVRAVNAAGVSANSAASNPVTPATVPGAPRIDSPQRGANGGALTAIARWSPPAATGGSAITGYQVTILRMSSSAANATVLNRTTSAVLAASARTREFTLPGSNYRFEVVAINAVGTSAPSARSSNVVPR